jgi:predicted MPP superfamily phosphohydrolase
MAWRALLIVGAGYAYLAWRLFGLSAGALALALPFAAMLWIPFVYWQREESSLGVREQALLWAGFLSMGYLSLLLAGTAVRDLAWLVTRSPVLIGPGSSAWVLIGALLALGLGVLEARRSPRLERVSVRIAGLPAGFSGYRIVQISDLHVGHTVSRRQVERVVSIANSAGADLIVLTGDLVDGEVSALRETFSLLGQLQARDGVFYVTGNHEGYWGGEHWVEEIRRLGITPLLNEHRVLRKGEDALVLAGTTDTDPDPERALQGAPPRDRVPRVLLAHQPKVALVAEPLGFDLQLSGHTHGGQFFPWTLIIGWFHPVARGLGRHGRLALYVNRGSGYWGPPIRLGSPSEITCLELYPEAV